MSVSVLVVSVSFSREKFPNLSMSRVMTSYHDLLVWQKAIDFVVDTYRLTGQFPRTELYGLMAQLQRAVVSVPSNIAEGAGEATLANSFTISVFLGDHSSRPRHRSSSARGLAIQVKKTSHHF